MENIILRRFDSIHKFVNHACENPDKHGASHKSGNDGGWGDNWSGTDTFDEAVKFAKYGGWKPEYAPTIRSGFDTLVPRLRKYVDFELERRMDSVGDEVNVGLYVEGDPDHMINWVPDEFAVTKRALCLLIGHSVSAGCSSEELFVRGQAVIGLVRALSLLGFELEIWSEETVGWGDKYSTLVRLHAAGSVMDESAVEFAIGNPAWLRRLLFASQENEPMDIRSKFGFVKSGGYGSVQPITFGDMVGADLELNLGRTWFSGREEGAIGWIVEQLKSLGALPEDLEFDDE